jgi:hypothetical protein
MSAIFRLVPLPEPRMRRLVIVTTCAVVALAAACGEKAPPPPRTEAEQRTVDSTIGASAIPGSGGVRGALAAQDSAKAKQAQLDSIMKAPQ